MNITEIVQDFLTGEPVTDSIIIGVLFVCFITFFDIMISALFSPFKRK